MKLLLSRFMSQGLSGPARALARGGVALLLALVAVTANAVGVTTCQGRFPNPITDICWSCIMPISLGGGTLASIGGQEDIGNPGSPICSCGVNPTIGLSIGFWEPRGSGSSFVLPGLAGRR